MILLTTLAVARGLVAPLTLARATTHPHPNTHTHHRATSPKATDGGDLAELPAFTLDDVAIEADAEFEPPTPPPPDLNGLKNGEWRAATSVGPMGQTLHTLQVAVADKLLTFESGRVARLASGAVTLTVGETNVFCTACLEKPKTPSPIDFTPLRVDYQERSSAVGQTKRGYIKRDGRPSDHETLVSRLIDRPIRPLIPEGWACETQLAATVLSYDATNLPDVLAICGASAALSISEVPFPRPVAAVRVAIVDGEIVVNPTNAQTDATELDMIIAGTADAVLMVEGFGDFVPEARMLDAIEAGMAAIATIARALEDWRPAAGKPPYVRGLLPRPPGLAEAVASTYVGGSSVPEAMRSAMSGGTKEDRERGVYDLYDLAIAQMEAEAAGNTDLGFAEVEVRSELKKLACKTMRELAAETGVRTDGRRTDEVRPIAIEMAPLPPSVHGSAIFTRGETQALATTTIGDTSMAQRFEDLEGEGAKRFYLQYSFPPYSVGEVGRIGAPGRREVGHGHLAERALRPAIPSDAEFPYVMRVESLITESCGSSSMASVCGGCLSLLAAGVPLKRKVAGVAMGLLLDESGGEGEPIVLTDILGSEDALGTMDFKVAGDAEGITAFQLDIKCEGLSLPLMRRALEQARVGRLHILGLMEEACPEPLALPASVPRVRSFTVPAGSVGKIIGSGGATINGIVADTGVTAINIDKSDPPVVSISSTSDAAIELATARVQAIAGGDATFGSAPSPSAPPPPPSPPPPPINVGDEFEACQIKNIVPFGIFVSLHPGIDGFCHISQLSEEYIKDINDVGLTVGDEVDVVVTQFNEQKKQYRIEVTSEFSVGG